MNAMNNNDENDWRYLCYTVNVCNCIYMFENISSGNTLVNNSPCMLIIPLSFLFRRLILIKKPLISLTTQVAKLNMKQKPARKLNRITFFARIKLKSKKFFTSFCLFTSVSFILVIFTYTHTQILYTKSSHFFCSSSSSSLCDGIIES